MMRIDEIAAAIESASEEDLDKILAQLHMLDDFQSFSRSILKVQTPQGKIVNFELNNPQKILHRIIEDHIRPKRLVRIVALKARRMGFSTYFSGRFYQSTSCQPNRYAIQITHEPDATDFLFKMVKRFYNLSPNSYKPATLYNNTRLLEFNTKDGTGLNSAFRVATAGKDDVGSGQLIHYAHFCLAPDTPILVEDGREISIKDVEVGQHVVTHTGNYARVSAKTKVSHKDLPNRDVAIVVRPWMGSDMVMTPEHKVWTNMGWIKAGDLDPNWHMLSMPIRKISHSVKSIQVQTKFSKYGPGYNGPASVETTEEAGFFVGYYLAEGCVSRTRGNDWYHRVVLALHQKEDAFADRALRFAEKYCKSSGTKKNRPGTKTKIATVNSTVLANFLAVNFGASDNKHIPDAVFRCGEDFCRGLVAGYIAGDGSKGIGGAHQNYESNAVCVSSIRESLVYQVRDIIAALGYGWGRVKFKDGFIDNRGKNNRPQWTLQLSGQPAKQVRKIAGIPYADIPWQTSAGGERYRLDPQNGQVWIKIKNLRKTTVGEFYDIEVDHPDHSFRTPSFSVSNSEVSKWAAHNTTELLTSIMPTIPDSNDSAIVFESTAKGIGGEFYDRFWGARHRIWISRIDDNGDAVITDSVNEEASEDDEYTSLFLPWFCFEDYQVTVPPGFKLQPEEIEVAKRHNLSDRQMAWRRWTIANKCNKSIDVFNQEYPDNPRTAFLGTGRPVFDAMKIANLMEAAPSPIARYEFYANNWTVNTTGRLRVWEEPRDGEAYIVSADVAEGLRDGDYCCADVVNHRTGQQVAQWHGHVDADNIHEYADIIAGLGRRYNVALLVPERNNHGLAVVTQLYHNSYPRLYVEEVPDPPGRPRKRYGWVTSRSTRPLIIDNLISEVQEDTHGIVCRETFDEMLSFKRQDNGKMEADTGRFDDRVMSLAIAKYVRQITELPAMRRDKHIKSRREKPARTKVNPKGWT